jgi:hypothetical protein
MRHEMPYDPVLITDVYNRLAVAKQNNYTVDSAREAEGLSSMVRVLGNSPRQVAIVPEGLPEVEMAYNRASFLTVPMNGNRPQALMEFITNELSSLYATKPQNLVIVTSDPAFALMASNAARMDIRVQIWAPGAIPPQLASPEYSCRQLESLIRGTISKVAKVAVYLDYENLHIGLLGMGIDPDPQVVVPAVRSLTADLGNVVDMIAYADWYELSKNTNRDIQRELAMLGVKTHYQISRHGKNSADMALANDIRTRIGRQGGDPDEVDMIVLGSRDRDFTTIVREAQKDKKVVILGLSEGISRDLEMQAEVRYIDKVLAKHQSSPKGAALDESQFGLLMRITAYMYEHKYSWVHAQQIRTMLATQPGDQAAFERLRSVGIVKVWRSEEPHKLTLDQHQTDAYIARWVISRIDYCLNQKGMPYVDTSFLVKGMLQDHKLQEFGITPSRQEAVQILERGAASGCLVKEHRPHPKDSSSTIFTWRLAGKSKDVESAVSDEPGAKAEVAAEPQTHEPAQEDTHVTENGKQLGSMPRGF